jgi:hypothetical protein
MPAAVVTVALVRELPEQLCGLFPLDRLLERHGHCLVTLELPGRRAVQVLIGEGFISCGGRVIM